MTADPIVTIPYTVARAIAFLADDQYPAGPSVKQLDWLGKRCDLATRLVTVLLAELGWDRDGQRVVALPADVDGFLPCGCHVTENDGECLARPRPVGAISQERAGRRPRLRRGGG